MGCLSFFLGVDMPLSTRESLDNYEAAKAKLERAFGSQLLRSPQNQTKARELLAHVEGLKVKGKQDLVDLTEILDDTASLLNHSMTVADYRAKAENVQGSSSLGMKIAGGIMIALAGLVGLACGALAMVGIILTGESVVGAGVLAAGIGLFSGGLRSGLSAAMHDVAKEYENTPKIG